MTNEERLKFHKKAMRICGIGFGILFCSYLLLSIGWNILATLLLAVGFIVFISGFSSGMIITFTKTNDTPIDEE